MKKIILNLAVSIDGYIAKNDGSVDWIKGDGSQPNVTMNDLKFDIFLKGIDVIIMGKKSYQITQAFGDINKQFPGKKIIVLSHEIIKNENIEVTQKPLKDVVNQIKNNIWLFGGGNVIKQFLEANLVTHIILTLIPITLGSGIKLFQENNNQNNWKLIDHFAKNGLVVLQYLKIKNNL